MPRVVGSIAKVAAATGWQPEIPLRQTLGDLLEYWRRELGR
jgi:GDP-4-dehydro-6-deoxy-D-mannose reductase